MTLILKIIVILFECLLLSECQVLDNENPIYVNHYFARQLFRYFNESKVSNECRFVADFVKNHVQEEWALRLYDASGTIPAGVAKGNFQFMGNFDECLDIDVIFNQTIRGLNGFHGQYCTLELPIESVFKDKQLSAINVTELHLNPTLGICIPSTCSLLDLTELMNSYHRNTGLIVSISHCTDNKSEPIEWYHILIMSGFVVLIIFLIIGTFVDIKYLFSKIDFPSKLTKTVVSFSVYTNTIKLFKTNNEKETIGCFHGFRLISILFIILYHIYTEAQIPSANILEILESESNFMLQIVTNGGLWVEAFFLLSGFLCSYGQIRVLRKTSIKDYKPVKNLIHRYLRLTPSLIGIIGFSILQEIMGSGPQWFRYVETSQTTCHKNWWTNILYINNFIGLNQLGENQSECLSYTWYLAVDMQLFLISPILIIFLASNDTKKQIIGIFINLSVIIISFIITGVLTFNYGLTPTVLMNVYDLEYINKVYKQSYCRVGPYSVGILMAYFFIKYKGNIRIRHALNILLWILSITLNLVITFLTWPWLIGNSYHNFVSVLYASTHRTLWSLSWAYILFACSTGYGGIFNTILSWKAIIPLSKLSFQAYLTHSVLISRFVYEARQPFYSSKLNLIMLFFQYTFLTFLFSYIAFLMFEIPFANIEKVFSNRNIKRELSVENIISDDNNNENNNQTNYGSNDSHIQISQNSSKL